MSKQRPDGDNIANELAGASGFFKPREVSPAPLLTSSEQTTRSATAPTPETDRTPVRPVRVAKRQMIRHAFELYLDQLERLRQAAQIEREEGGAGSMSKMVREAIDRYLEQLPPVAE